jgi:4-hydroxybenzoate polyprenyltransferase
LEIAGIALSAVLLCMAGNLLNDWHDRAWDASHRPERALPSGHFRPETFLILGSALLFLGVAAMFCFGAQAGGVALGIAACIVIYTRCHKRTVWSVIPLAMCRALLPLMGTLAMVGAAAVSPMVLALCAALFLWVCGLSLDARGESTGGARRSPVAWIFILAAPGLLAVVLTVHSVFSWFELTPVALWLALVRGPFRHTAKQRVSALLAGLPLLDFMVLAPVWSATLNAPHGILWIPIAAFALGRFLQRAAAAT